MFWNNSILYLKKTSLPQHTTGVNELIIGLDPDCPESTRKVAFLRQASGKAAKKEAKKMSDEKV
jgi:hypothetical protein